MGNLFSLIVEIFKSLLTVNITFAHRIVILDGKQKLNATDTLTYKININQFGMPEALKNFNNQIIKLVKYNHKEE